MGEGEQTPRSRAVDLKMFHTDVGEVGGLPVPVRAAINEGVYAYVGEFRKDNHPFRRNRTKSSVVCVEIEGRERD